MLLKDYLRAVYVPAKLDLGAEWVRHLGMSIAHFGRWLGRDATLADLQEDSVRRFLADFLGTHRPSSTNNQRRNLLAIWQSAFDEGLVAAPPRRNRIPRIKLRPTVPEAWTPRQVARLLVAADSAKGDIAGIDATGWWRSFVLVLYDTGARRSAALAVRTADIDLVQGSVVFRRTKTGRMRWAPLHSETVTACASIHDPCRGLMWPWEASLPALEKRFRLLCRRASIPHGHLCGGLFHKLRRTSGSLVEANGGDGARHLGNTRAVFERAYCDPRLIGRGQLDLLPRPRL